MASRNTSPAMTFVDAWGPEFVKSIAMFTGMTLRAVPAPADAAVDPAEAKVWHEQLLTRGSQGRLWVGLPMEKTLALADAAADGPTERLALMRETLDQSIKATAQVLNTGDCPGLQCADEQGTNAPPEAVAGSETVWFQASTGEMLACTIHWNQDFEGVMTTAAPTPMSQALVPEVVQPAAEAAAFERFVGVELPVSVVLGRATLRVRDVLKLAVGSLIELDTRTTDPVDVCVHDGVVARGEVVSIRGNYGIRIVEVMSQRDRLNLEFKNRRHVPATDGSVRAPRVH